MSRLIRELQAYCSTLTVPCEGLKKNASSQRTLSVATQWTMVPTQGVRPDAFECELVAMVLRECYPYLRSIDPKPSMPSCNGAKDDHEPGF
ncbi:hypothetical protein OIU77_029551 [Salix suchowensis]|uniref:Uncharacterized protein n=1 Tax=Salix suchowensis TaxID=1278906 RepID=A0ABQ9B9N9_9ROSI|nr:hypothetical protein OIU77_029551 [Salix suchowensis]